MPTKPKTRDGEIRSILRRAKIYDHRLEPQILQTVRLEKMLAKIEDELFRSPFVDTEISASGTEKKVANPLLLLSIKLEQNLKDCYTALGLNYNARSSNIRESVTDDKVDENPLISFTKGLK